MKTRASATRGKFPISVFTSSNAQQKNLNIKEIERMIR